MINIKKTPLGTLEAEIYEALNKFSQKTGVFVGSIVTTTESHISARQGFEDISRMYFDLDVNFKPEGKQK